MNTRLAANLSVFSTFAMLLLSFSFGFHYYTQTEKAIIADLNQALQHTVMQNSRLWINQDTLQTYSRLSTLFGNPVSIESYNQEFSEALNFVSIKGYTGILVQVKNKKEAAGPQPITGKELMGTYLASDTVIWISANADTTGRFAEDIGISFQGYAKCPTGLIFRLANNTLSILFLLLSILSGCLYLYIRRIQQIDTTEDNNTAIAVGNLLLAVDRTSFCKENGEKLKLTPQQYTLMEMFFLSPTHILTRTDICENLWPGKMNADETLNTLVRRLRPLIEENSNLKITTDRGRAYILELQSSCPDEKPDH